ncbi:Wzz/FepE/Etk N-terminal domain-containing protein [Vibrio campbellii]|uniref:Wzz/FepE/Etk N-terminal domain-containing protein n=1 Tax=Vibrio campbellii TaxID=680 RepID=UPI00210A4A85|nr:Wzz/FepE/Etk N-terminal domain-containing protein [Vibrio campbellii]UTZ40102.1 LPS O-antigen length regulator [Vibrio campbellii]
MVNDNLEIDLSDLIKLLWKQKWLVIFITVFFSIASVLFALSKPNLFRSEAVLFPVSDENSPSGTMSQLGGIAALAGLGGEDGSKQQVALEILRSRAFLMAFIERRDILVPLMALKEWNYRTDTITYDSSIYDVEDKKWVREVREGKDPKPTLLEAYEELNELIEITKSKSGATIIAVLTQSPKLSQQWVEWLLEDLNTWMKEKDIRSIRDNIHYLKAQLSNTQLSETQTVFYQLIEEQIKKLMLAEAQREYVYEVIDPPVVPEEKDSPSRGIICVLGTFLGGLLSIIVALVRIALSRSRK